MTRIPVQAADPLAWNYIQVRIPGRLKNEIISLAAEQNCSVNIWITQILESAVRAKKGIPEPPPARAPLPTVRDELRAYLKGEKLLTPCGREGSCTGTETPPMLVDGLGFCSECSIRVS